MSKIPAQRANTGKPKLSLVLDAREALEGVSRVMEFGANKYERSDWLRGQNVTVVMDSLMRHLLKYNKGEDIDEESGLPHVDHIATNALFLSTFARREELDDRYKEA